MNLDFLDKIRIFQKFHVFFENLLRKMMSRENSLKNFYQIFSSIFCENSMIIFL